MISITGLGQCFTDALGLPGQVAVRKLINDLVELPTGISLAVDSVETSPVVKENDVEKACVGMIFHHVFENVDRPAVVLFLVVKVGHLGDRIPDPAAFGIVFEYSLVCPKGLLEVSLPLIFTDI